MINLALSLFALVLGPLLWVVCQRSDFARSFLESVLFVTIAGIVFIHIVPESFEVTGWVAIVFLLLGIGFAYGLEKFAIPAGVTPYSWVLVLAALGLAVHAMIDGLALLSNGGIHDIREFSGHGSTHDSGHHRGGRVEALLNDHVALGVILHRVGVSMAIWWTLRPQMGTSAAVAALVLIGVATSVAYFVGYPLLEILRSTGIAWFQAFVAGSLLHIIVHSEFTAHGDREKGEQRMSPVGSRLGIIAGLVLILLVPGQH